MMNVKTIDHVIHQITIDERPAYGHDRRVLEALGFETAHHQRVGEVWKTAPGQRWNSRPCPMRKVDDALYVARMAGMHLESVQRIPNGDAFNYSVQIAFDNTPAGAYAAHPDLAVAFTLAMLRLRQCVIRS